MKRSKPMKRTGFRRPSFEPAPSAPPQPIAREMRERIRTGPAVLRVMPKSQPARHEGYRRIVASMPCAWCGIAGYSQCAHMNLGKGLVTKVDDRASFPACGPRLGDPGCHATLDSGGVLTKEARRLLEESWARQTRTTIMSRGLWPADLEHWPEPDE